MNLSTVKLPFHYLKPGEMFIGEKPAVISTLLGSCVSVTMFSPRLRVGAICHGILPSCKGNDRCSCTEAFRYVECAVRWMTGKFEQIGAVRGEIEVKIFGGSDMFSVRKRPATNATVGSQNIKMALQVIDQEGLRLLVSDVGGQRGRKILFYTHTGEVFMKRLSEGDSRGLLETFLSSP